MLKHVVAVNLNYEEGDPRIAGFFAAAKELLTQIPQVKGYGHYRTQNPEQCGWEYGFILEFDSTEALGEFHKSPHHKKFAEEHWSGAVKDVVDINFVPI